MRRRGRRQIDAGGNRTTGTRGGSLLPVPINQDYMTPFETQKLIHNRKWTALLCGLVVGENELFFPSIEAMKSCKTIAYDINTSTASRNAGRHYKFKVSKIENGACRVIVSVSEV